MSMVSFSDGSSMNVIGIWFGREYIFGSERDFVEIIFDGNSTEYADVKALYDRPEIFDTIQYTKNEDDGTTVSVDYSDYIVPVNIVSQTKEDNLFTISLRYARKTTTEKSEEKLAQENEVIQMALVELAQSYAELEERLKMLESENSTETTTIETTEEV